MLEGWIYRGQLDDPYGEFMVAEERGLAKEKIGEDFNAAYWDRRCVVLSFSVSPRYHMMNGVRVVVPTRVLSIT